MNILSNIAAWVAGGFIALGLINAPVQPPVTETVNETVSEYYSDDAVVGAAVPQSPALYDGFLATGINQTQTSMSLSTGVLRNGQALSGYFCFTIDANTPQVEYVCGTASGTAVTNMMRGVDVINPNATSSALAFSHRRFASVAISDYPTLQILVRKINGTDTLDSPLQYSSTLSTTTIALDAKNIVNKAYVDSVAFNGAGVIDATASARGVSELATRSEASAGSTNGTTGVLVLPASIASSSYASGTQSVVVTNTTGKIAGEFVDSTTVDMGHFGDGRDGTVTIAATSSLSLTRDMYYENLTINGTLYPNGYRIFVKETATGTGSIIATGTPGTNGVLTIPGIGGSSTIGFFRNASGTNGTIGSTNVDCFSGANSSSSDVGVAFNANTSNRGGKGGGPISTGCGTVNGGDGGLINATATSTKYGFDYISTINFYHVSLATSTLVVYSGGGGTGGGGGYANCSSTCNGTTADSGGGGGGGSSGQIVFIAAKTLGGTFTINVSGGNGGNGGNGSGEGDTTAAGGGGGGGGNGGTCIKLYASKTYAGSCNNVGGTGGTPGTSGVSLAGTNGATGLNIEIPLSSLLR